MDHKKEISQLSMLVLAQVVMFVLVYLATIAFGFGLIYLAYRASLWFIPEFFVNIAPGIMKWGKLGLVGIIGVLIFFAGLWAFVGAVALYLVKPLFIFPKRSRDHGKEIHREDSPRLYDMIMETAKAVGVRKPKHIYVNHDVNACVFFNTGFWNIFFPVRKNLAIGLGLFESTNVEEVRGILAHEFGHFAQSSMRVGSVLYVTNKVISDLVYRRDKLDFMMIRWCLGNGIWAHWGKATQTVIIRCRRLAEKMFLQQQRNYMRLSRQMEYDADAAACRVVGREAFVSALCKIQLNSKSFEYYVRVLNNMCNCEMVTVKDFWRGYNLTVPNMRELGFHISSYDITETTPDDDEAIRSRVSVEEIWESHPTLRNRILHAPKVDNIRFVKPVMAWELIEDALKKEISDTVIENAKKDGSPIKEMEWDTFKQTLSKNIEASVYPIEVDVFFSRSILDGADTDAVENPLDDSSRKVVREYEQARVDMSALETISEGDVPFRHFMYDGRRHSVDEVPLEEHRRYLESLEVKARAVDCAIRDLAMSKSGQPELIAAAYRAICYSQSIMERLSRDFLSVKGDIINALNAADIAGDDDYSSLKDWADSYEWALKDVLKSIKYRQMIPFMTKEWHDHVKEFLNASGSFMYGINTAAVRHMFDVTDWIMQIHDHLNRNAKMVVANTLLDKELPDVRFLKLWSDEEKSEEITESERSEDYLKGHVVIDSAFGQLNLPVPTDDEVDKVYYQEWFRCRIWEKFNSLEQNQKFDFALAATVPITEENGIIKCVNPEDEKKFNVELEEYRRFMKGTSKYPDWDVISFEADAGSAFANSRMAQLHFSNNRLAEAFDCAMKAALQYDSDGINMLGVIEWGRMNCDPELAARLFKCAAATGNMTGLYNLGLCYANGKGVSRDKLRAAKLFERAAMQGHIDAQYYFGNMFLYGDVIEPDPERGLYWLYEAANRGNVPAVNALWKYYKEQGDTEEYLRIVNIGANNGIEECRRELARITVDQL